MNDANELNQIEEAAAKFYELWGADPSPDVVEQARRDLRLLLRNRRAHRAPEEAPAPIIMVSHHGSDASPRDAKITPPRIAEWLIAVGCSRASQQATLGDLHEKFLTDIERVGLEQARNLYRAQAVRSSLAAAWELAKAYLKVRFLDRFLSH